MASLPRLSERSLAKNVPTRTFVNYFGQLNSRHLIDDAQFLEFLSLHGDNLLHAEYVAGVVLSDDDIFTRLWPLLASIPPPTQTHILTKLAQLVTTHKSLGLANVSEPVAAYIRTLLGDTESHVAVLNAAVVLLDVMLSHNIVDHELLNPVIHELTGHLGDSGGFSLHRLLVSKSATASMSYVPLTAMSSKPSSAGSLELNPLSKKNRVFVETRRFLVLHHAFRNWNVALVDSDYAAATTESGSVLALEFTRALLLGHSLVSGAEKFVWANYVKTRLPLVLKEIAFNEEDSIENALKKAFSAVDSADPLRNDFLKSCLLNQVIGLTLYHKFVPNDKYTEISLKTEISKNQAGRSAADTLKAKLLDVNSEFTLLEESGLVEYFAEVLDSMRYSAKRQSDFAQLVWAMLSSLIEDKDLERVSRLMMVLSGAPDALSVYCFADGGPHKLLGALVTFLDEDKLNADDDDNFQELYAQFGAVLLAIIHIVTHFRVDVDAYVLSSFTIDYINNFFNSLADNLTGVHKLSKDEDDTIVANYNNLLLEWINALFDDANDGLSDDLLKSINVKQTYRIIPIIFQQAINATSQGIISHQILSNGLDYLLQVFLVPTTISILKWLTRRITLLALNNPTYEENTYVRVLGEIISTNAGLGLAFKLVLIIVGPDVVGALQKYKNWTEIEAINKIIDQVGPVRESTHVAMASPGDLKFHLNSSKDLLQFLATHTFDPRELLESLVTETERLLGGDELARLFVNVVLFMVQREPYTINPPKRQDPEQDFEFSLPMDYHYSTIFTDLVLDDDLFSDQALPVVDLIDKAHHLQLAAHFNRIAQAYPEAKSVALLREKLLVS